MPRPDSSKLVLQAQISISQYLLYIYCSVEQFSWWAVVVMYSEVMYLAQIV